MSAEWRTAQSIAPTRLDIDTIVINLLSLSSILYLMFFWLTCCMRMFRSFLLSSLWWKLKKYSGLPSENDAKIHRLRLKTMQEHAYFSSKIFKCPLFQNFVHWNNFYCKCSTAYLNNIGRILLNLMIFN